MSSSPAWLRNLTNVFFRNSRSSRRSKGYAAAPRHLRVEGLEERTVLAELGIAFGLGSEGFDFGTSVATDTQGNFYVAGEFNDTVDIDPGPGVVELTGNSFGNFVAKYSFDGALLWASVVDLNSVTDIAVDGLGNTFVTGLGTTASASVVSLDSEGSVAWVQDFGPSLPELAIFTGLAADGEGNVFATGFFRGRVDFDPGAGVFHMTSKNTASGSATDDVFVLKLNRAGGFVWARQFGGAGNDIGNDIAVDGAGSVYTTGAFAGIVDLNPGLRTFNVRSGGPTAAFMSKLDRAGNFVFGNLFDRNTIAVTATGIALDVAGNIYIVGSQIPASGGNSALLVARFNSAGAALLSLNAALPSGSHAATDIAIDGLGNLYVTGVFSGTLRFGATTLISAGLSDAFLVKFAAGNNSVVSFRQMGGAGNDLPGGIAVDRAGTVYVTGRFEGTADFNPGFPFGNSSAALTSAGGLDAFVAQFTESLLAYTAPADGLADDLTLHLVGTNLELFDNNKLEVVASRPFSQTAAVAIFGAADEDDTLTINYSPYFAPLLGIQFHGGASGTDRLRVIGQGSPTDVLYTPDAIATGDGVLETVRSTQRSKINFTGLEDSQVQNFFALTFNTPNSNDQILFEEESGADGQPANMISGTSGGVAYVPLTFADIIDLTLRADVRDTARAPNDEITIDASGLFALGSRNVTLNTGKGDDLLRVLAGNLLTPVAGGLLQWAAGLGTDRLVADADQDFILRNTELQVRVDGTAAGAMRFSSVEQAALTGGPSDNVLDASAFSGTVTLDGAEGNDTLISNNKGADLIGGDGDDTLRAGTGNDFLDGGSGDDVLDAGSGNNTVDGGTGDDRLTAGRGSDKITGGDGNDIISAGDGNNTVDAGDGQDTVTTGTGDDFIELGEGDDEVKSGAGDDEIDAGEGDDQIDAGTGDDVIFAGAGLDEITGGTGNDVIEGGDGDDLLVGGTGNDRLIGGAGVDVLLGGDGRDYLKGDEGSDDLDGGAGTDTMDGCLDLDTFDLIEIFLNCDLEDPLPPPL